MKKYTLLAFGLLFAINSFASEKRTRSGKKITNRLSKIMQHLGLNENINPRTETPLTKLIRKHSNFNLPKNFIHSFFKALSKDSFDKNCKFIFIDDHKKKEKTIKKNFDAEDKPQESFSSIYKQYKKHYKTIKNYLSAEKKDCILRVEYIESDLLKDLINKNSNKYYAEGHYKYLPRNNYDYLKNENTRDLKKNNRKKTNIFRQKRKLIDKYFYHLPLETFTEIYKKELQEKKEKLKKKEKELYKIANEILDSCEKKHFKKKNLETLYKNFEKKTKN